MDHASPINHLDWKKFLQLAEELLRHNALSQQTDVIADFISSHLNARASIYFASPAYPLPGEPGIPTLPNMDAPAIVKKAFRDRCIQTRHTTPRVAMPLILRDLLLGVLLVERGGGKTFTEEELLFLQGATNHITLALNTLRQISLKNWRFDQLALVRSVSAKIANLGNIDELSQQVAQLIHDTFDFYMVSIFTLDASTGILSLKASAGPENANSTSLAGFSIRLGEGIVGMAAKSSNEIHVPDVNLEPLFRYDAALPETRAEVALPLKVEERVLGVLDIQNDEARAIHEFDLSVLRILADNVALAIEGAQIYSYLGKRTSQISAVLDISHAVSSTLEFDKLLDTVVNSINKHFNYDFIHIYSVHPGHRKIYYETGSGARSKDFEELQVSFDLDDPNGIIPWVAREGRIRLANDVATEPLYRPSFLLPESTKSELAIPLKYASEILGVLDLQTERANGFDEGDLPLLEAMAASIAIAIRNARLYQSEIWRRKVADSFLEISTLVSANTPLEDLLARILDLLDRILPCQAAAIWLLNKEPRQGEKQNPTLRLAATRGVEREQLLDVMEQEESIRELLTAIIELEEPSIRTPEDPVGPLGKANHYHQNYSSISAPLRAGNEPLGVLLLAHPEAGRYGSEAGLISMTFANNAAIAIQNSRLFTAAQEQAWISTVLLKVAEAAQNSLNTDELLQTMARLTPLLIGVKKCAFFLWDENLLSFILKAQYELDAEGLEGLALGQEIPVVQRLVSTRQPVFITNSSQELPLNGFSMAVKRYNFILLPMLSRGKILGAFLVGYQNNKTSGRIEEFDQENLTILLGIAQQTAVAIENLQLLEAQQEEAYVTAVLLQVAQAVVSQNTLEDIMDTIVHLMPILVGINSCGIYLWDRQKKSFITEKIFTGSSQFDQELTGKIYPLGAFPLLDTVLQRDELLACRLEDPQMIPAEWTSLTHFIPGDELNEQYPLNTSWMLGIPLSIKGELYGVMLAAEKNVPPSIHTRRQEIISGIAQQVSLSIQNDHLNREMVERERLEKEISLARQIQRTFLPARLPKPKGWELAVSWQTAREVGGDFYDLIKIGPDKLGIVIADVSDKGMPAALYMTVARTLIRAFVHQIPSPARLLERVNRLLVVDSRDGLYVTAVYAVLNLKDGTLNYANAGHNLPVLIHSPTRRVESLPKGGMALGIQASHRLEEHTLEICPGDQLILYTDGVTESFSPEGKIFGETNLIKALSAAPEFTAEKMIQHLNRVLGDFRQGTSPSDDLTLVVIHRLGTENSLPDDGTNPVSGTNSETV